jgi:chorismate--pyruvate lyase
MMAWTFKNAERGQIRRWMGATGSLSARLAGSGQVFSVQVLQQGRQSLGLDEARALGLPGRCVGYTREVVLRVDGVAVVFARSVTQHVHSLGPWRAVRGLGSRPLADVLFKRSGIARTPLAFTRIKPSTRLGRDVASAWQRATSQGVTVRTLPARRSVFTRRGAPLLVMEIFAAQPEPWCWPCSRSISKSKQPFLPKNEAP